MLKITKEQEANITRMTWIGVIPFVVMAVLVVIGVWVDELTAAFVLYSAMVLSFLAGTHWGIALIQGTEQQALRMAVSGLTAVAVWFVALLLPAVISIPVLAASYVIWMNYDLRLFATTPYENIRRPSTFVIAGSHFLVFAMVMTPIRMAAG